MGIAHWDEVEGHRRAKGEMDATWQRLGAPAGAKTVGLNRVCVAPGMLPTPPHSHGASEELYFVLGGSGLAWQDEHVHEVRAGDCIVHLADHHEHTFIAGPEGLDYLVFGTNYPTELGWLPRSGAVRIGWPWVEGRTDDPWDVEAQQPALAYGDPAPRPDNMVNLEDVERHEGKSGPWAGLAAAAGSEQSGLNWRRVPPGRLNAVPHCHSEDEELFIVLEGDGTLELWPSPLAASQGGEREDIPVRAGHVVARPASSRVAHAFRGGESGMTLLVYGTRRPNDVCWYPRSNKLFWRGLGVIGRIESLDYWDGEPTED
jgi:uncharacterized cupin superfamily protein